jgi:hypothetical protein
MAALICKQYDKVLLGITCVAGNTTLPNVVTNALISCKIAGIHVPIFKGNFIFIKVLKKIFSEGLSFNMRIISFTPMVFREIS